MIDNTVKQMTDIIRYTSDSTRAASAVKTLIGLIPTYGRPDYEYVIQEMEIVIRFDKDIWRRDIASNVLIVVKNALG